MKTILLASLAAAVAAGLSLPAHAAGKDHGHGGHDSTKHAEGAPAAAMTDGLVKKVDKAAAKVTLSHGPLPNGMPAMTMAFRVKDPAWLDRLNAGDRIRFMAESVDGAMTLTRVERQP